MTVLRDLFITRVYETSLADGPAFAFECATAVGPDLRIRARRQGA